MHWGSLPNYRKGKIKHPSWRKMLSKGSYELTVLHVTCHRDLDHTGLIPELLKRITRRCGIVQHGLQDQTHNELWISTPIFMTHLIWTTRALACSLPNRSRPILWESNSSFTKSDVLSSSINDSSVPEKKTHLDEISVVTPFWVALPHCLSTGIKINCVTGHLEVLWQEKWGKTLLVCKKELTKLWCSQGCWTHTVQQLIT